MTKICNLLIAGAAIALATSAPASAQWAVIDAANLAQNINTAARTLEEVNDQIKQIQQLVQVVEADSRNLTSLPTSVLSQLQSSMSQLNGLMGRA